MSNLLPLGGFVIEYKLQLIIKSQSNSEMSFYFIRHYNSE